MIKRFSYDQILDGLMTEVAECVAVERDQVTPESKFISDFDADSLEILDITFRIHKRFGIRVHLQKMMEGWEVDSTGRLAASAQENLTNNFPDIDWATKLTGLSDPRDLLTVGLMAEIANYVQESEDSSKTNPPKR